MIDHPPTDRLTDEAHAEHIVQFHAADDRALIGNVTRYLAGALEQGDVALVVGTPQHIDEFARALAGRGIDVEAARRDGRLVELDAAETLARFMTGGIPDRQRFEATVGSIVRDACARSRGIGPRAYGEMVGILWQTRQYAAAISLEAFWNDLLQAAGFTLFCGYPIDVLAEEFSAADIDALLCAHSHVLPASTSLAGAIEASMDEVLGSAAARVRDLMSAGLRPSWAALPRGEAMILWLRHELPQYAPEIVARARSLHRAA
jgi:superfamily I DNA/RNA helicase